MILALLPFASGLNAGVLERQFINKPAPATPPGIKILLVHDKPGVILEVKGKYKLYNPHNNEHISTRFAGKRKYIQAIQDGLKWGEEFPDQHQLLIVPDNSEVTTVVDGIEYRGNIYVYDVGGTISVVNEPDIEDYLHSILTTKKTNAKAPEVLAASAITARTNAYYLTANPKNKFWAVDGRQVNYQGYAVIDRKNPIAPAIDATRYIILSRSGDSEEDATPFPAQWNSEAFGDSSTGEEILSRISLSDAETMAQKGQHAAQILAKAFPGTNTVLMHYPSINANVK